MGRLQSYLLLPLTRRQVWWEGPHLKSIILPGDDKVVRAIVRPLGHPQIQTEPGPVVLRQNCVL